MQTNPKNRLPLIAWKPVLETSVCQFLPVRMKENQLEMLKRKRRKPIKNDQRTTKSNAQTLFDQLEFFLISNTDSDPENDN